MFHLSAYARQRHDHAKLRGAEQATWSQIEQIAATWPTYGYRRMVAKLRQEGVGAITGKQCADS